MKNSISLFVLSFFCLTFMFSCQEEKKQDTLNIEGFKDIEWLTEQGYVLLDETHEDYDYIMSLLGSESDNPDEVDFRDSFCQWELAGHDPFPCDSGSGGNCTVFIAPKGSGVTACLVCVGGNDHGNADCF